MVIWYNVFYVPLSDSMCQVSSSIQIEINLHLYLANRAHLHQENTPSMYMSHTAIRTFPSPASRQACPSEFLLEDGNPDQPHHHKHQPDGQTGRGGGMGCLRHSQVVEQKQNNSHTRHQAPHHHDDYGLMKVGPAGWFWSWTDGSASRMWWSGEVGVQGSVFWSHPDRFCSEEGPHLFCLASFAAGGADFIPKIIKGQLNNIQTTRKV